MSEWNHGNERADIDWNCEDLAGIDSMNWTLNSLSVVALEENHGTVGDKLSLDANIG